MKCSELEDDGTPATLWRVKPHLLAALVASTLACEGDGQKQTGPNERDRALIEAQVRAHDCEAMQAALTAAQKRAAEKVSGAYSKKAFEELASLREAIAKDASALKVVSEPARKIVDAWRSMNERLAAVERRVAASFGDAGSDANDPATDLMALADEENKVFADLAKLCRK